MTPDTIIMKSVSARFDAGIYRPRPVRQSSHVPAWIVREAKRESVGEYVLAIVGFASLVASLVALSA